MRGDACSPTNLCRGSTTVATTESKKKKMTRATYPKPRGMSSTHSLRMAVVVFVILEVPVLLVNGNPIRSTHQRLCSTSLSNALKLVCSGHGGYNEPFAYGGEEFTPSLDGPSLVDECCHNACSLEMLAQYCKSASEVASLNSQDGKEEPLRIVIVPYSSTRELSAESRAGDAIESNEKIAKSKDRNCDKLLERDKRKRKHGDRSQLSWKGLTIREAERRRRTGGRVQALDIPGKRDDADDDYAREAALRVCRRRRRLRRRRHRGKDLREASIASAPDFKVGTTVPEPKDSMLLLFPSRMNLGHQRASKDLANSQEFDALEKFNSLHWNDLYDKIDERDRRVTPVV